MSNGRCRAMTGITEHVSWRVVPPLTILFVSCEAPARSTSDRNSLEGLHIFSEPESAAAEPDDVSLVPGGGHRVTYPWDQASHAIPNNSAAKIKCLIDRRQEIQGSPAGRAFHCTSTGSGTGIAWAISLHHSARDRRRTGHASQSPVDRLLTIRA